jgi:hypothetical protein
LAEAALGEAFEVLFSLLLPSYVPLLDCYGEGGGDDGVMGDVFGDYV